MFKDAVPRVQKTHCAVYYNDYLVNLILLNWRIWYAPNNASKWQMGFNSAFKWLIHFRETMCVSLRRPHKINTHNYLANFSFSTVHYVVRIVTTVICKF